MNRADAVGKMRVCLKSSLELSEFLASAFDRNDVFFWFSLGVLKGMKADAAADFDH